MICFYHIGNVFCAFASPSAFGHCLARTSIFSSIFSGSSPVAPFEPTGLPLGFVPLASLLEKGLKEKGSRDEGVFELRN